MMDKKSRNDVKLPAKAKPVHPTPYGAKSQNNKGNKVQIAYQKKNNAKGR